jgi:hypothetical protein
MKARIEYRCLRCRGSGFLQRQHGSELCDDCIPRFGRIVKWIDLNPAMVTHVVRVADINSACVFANWKGGRVFVDGHRGVIEVSFKAPGGQVIGPEAISASIASIIAMAGDELTKG